MGAWWRRENSLLRSGSPPSGARRASLVPAAHQGTGAGEGGPVGLGAGGSRGGAGRRLKRGASPRLRRATAGCEVHERGAGCPEPHPRPAPRVARTRRRGRERGLARPGLGEAAASETSAVERGRRYGWW